MNNHILYSDKPGHNFESGTPIGNGSMGALLLCDPHHDTIWLSEETIWSGDVRDTTVPEFRSRIDELRSLYLNGTPEKIDEIAEKSLTEGIETIKSCEYAGKIEIDFETKGKIRNYSRKLHLNEGYLTVDYLNDNSLVSMQAFSSYSYEVTVINYTFGRESAFDLKFSRELIDEITFAGGIMQAVCHTAYGNHRFAVGIKVETDGTVDFINDTISVDEAENATIYISICTEFNFKDRFKTMCREMLEDAEDYESIKEQAIDDFSELFEMSSIDFESSDELEAMPVDKRIERLKNDKDAVDNGLYALYFDFGKYLIISSSRETTLPAHLQGVWVEKMENPWNSDYHTNINLQMNYWLSEVANLSETHLPLFDYMNKYLLKSGMYTAQENYRCRGTVLHHLSDIYGFTTPADGLWGVWPMGGAWLSYHIWEHWLYTENEEFLREEGYEYLRQCALFFIDYMFEDKNGRLLTGPSTSPENRYLLNPDDEDSERYLCFAPTMDIEIVTGVLQHFIEADKLLDIHPEEREEAENALSKMPPLQVGARGQLQEWLEDYAEPEPGHRHISHAFGLFPGDMITRKTPEYFKAIGRSLDIRLENGGGHTGWSRAWLISLFARLRRGDDAYNNIRALLTKSTNENMFDMHPPFQIDGNFGGAAGIAETLIQSHEGFISILPAVNSTLTGSFTGLRARGNYEVSAEFENGRLLSFSIESPDSDKKKVLVELPDDYECKLPKKGKLYEYTIA